MINRTILLEDVSAMAGQDAAAVITINCPRGYRYKDITLKARRSNNLTLTTAQAFGEIQVKMGGGIQRRADCVKLDAINGLNGAGYASQLVGTSGTDMQRHLKIFMEEPWRTRIRTNSVDTNALGWKTGWLSSNKPLQISVAMPAAGAGLTWSLSAEATISDDDDGKTNAIIKWEQSVMNAAAITTMSNLDNGLKADDRIVQLSIFDGTTALGVLSTVRLEVGSIVIKQDQTALALSSELVAAGMSPATAIAIAPSHHIVFDKNDALDDTLPVGFISSLLKLTYVTGSEPTGSVPYVLQTFGAPNRS